MAICAKIKYSRATTAIAVGIVMMASLCFGRAWGSPQPESPTLHNLSVAPGLNALVGIVGERTNVEIQALEDSKPVQGKKIRFIVLVSPQGAKGQRLLTEQSVTDGEGKAQVGFVLGSKKGTYVVGAFVDGKLEIEPLRINIEARDSSWMVFLIFGLLGGLGIFLMGMELSSDGLKDAAGDKMRGVLSTLTANRVMALLIGIVATAILQSSSASTVMLVGFVSARMMDLVQAIGVILGAKIGTTITAQLIAFDLSKYSLMLVALGFIMRVAAKRKVFKQAGGIILGFGLIFFGLGVMGSSMRPLRTVPAFTQMLVNLGENPLLAILVATAFTAVVQSSAATIGLAIALCASGLLSLHAGLPMAWGAHIGTCATALLSSLGTGREGKQVAVSHLIVSVLGVAMAFPFLDYFIDASIWLTSLMGTSSTARQLANGHMIFTVISGMVMLPLIPQIAKITRLIIPKAKTEPTFGPIYLVETSMSVPVLALEQAHREIIRMMQIVHNMLKTSIELLANPDEEGVEKLSQEDDKVDILERSIRPFLARVAQQGLEPKLSAREHAFIYLIQDLENIGDVLTKEVAASARKLGERGLSFSEQGLLELQQYHDKIVAKFVRIQRSVKEFDRHLAEETLQLSFKERMLERKLRQAHIERLHCDAKASVETSELHFSVLNNLRGISEKLDNIARTILEEI